MRRGRMKTKSNKFIYFYITLFVLLIGTFSVLLKVNNIRKNEVSPINGALNQEQILTEQDDENLLSNRYLITDNTIEKVKEETTVEDIKASLNKEVKFYKDNTLSEQINTGKVFSGMVVEDNNNLYNIIVSGDVNQDRKVDQIDITKISGNKFDNIDMEKAADINFDGICDIKDENIIAKKIVFGELDIQASQNVQSPEIEVLDSPKGSNDWYIDNVSLKIHKKDPDSVKTVYKIKGTKPIDITQITENDTITLDKDGVYKIIAYSYGNDGNRSKITSQIIKISKTGIIPSITYSPTEQTNGKVVAAIQFNKDGVSIINNDGKNTYDFLDNGNFTFEYIDEAGRTGKADATVNWIVKDEIVGSDNQWKYCINSDNTIQLTQYLGNSLEVTVPSEYDLHKVYSVGAQENVKVNIFNSTENTTVTNIVFSQGIKEIKPWALYRCSGIKGNITFPESVEKIGKAAFAYCTGITKLSFPSTLREIGYATFDGCTGLRGDLIIPEGVEILDVRAFNECSGIDGTLSLPSTLKNLGKAAFRNCSKITGNIVIPEGVPLIEEYTFYHCNGFNGTLSLPNGIKSIGKRAFSSCTNLKGNITIPEGVTSIDEQAFYKCKGFDGILTLPSTLENIGQYDFYQCSNLKGDIIIPNNVSDIGMAAFGECANFNGKLNLSDKITSINDYTFYGCSNLNGDIIIPNSVLSIGKSAFYHCFGFNGILKLCENLQTIGDSAFSNCTGLTGDLIIPNKVTSIGMAAFAGCENFNGKLNLPSNLIYVGDFAFSKDIGFNNQIVYLPKTLQKIGSDYTLDGQNVGIGTHLFYNFGAKNGNFKAIEVEKGNENFVSENGILYTKDKKRLICYPRNKEGITYQMPDEVKLLDQMSIASNMEIKTLIISDNLSFDLQTFPNFTIQNTHLLDTSLYSYNSIEDIIAKESNLKYASKDGVLYTKDFKDLVYISSGRTKEVVIPEGVETIKDKSMSPSQVANGISKLYIPASVINISDATITYINNNQIVSKIEVSTDNPIFKLDTSGKLIKK